MAAALALHRMLRKDCILDFNFFGLTSFVCAILAISYAMYKNTILLTTSMQTVDNNYHN